MFMFHSRDHEVAPQELEMPEAAQRPVGLRIWRRWGGFLQSCPTAQGSGVYSEFGTVLLVFPKMEPKTRLAQEGREGNPERAGEP